MKIAESSQCLFRTCWCWGFVLCLSAMSVIVALTSNRYGINISNIVSRYGSRNYPTLLSSIEIYVSHTADDT